MRCLLKMLAGRTGSLRSALPLYLNLSAMAVISSGFQLDGPEGFRLKSCDLGVTHDHHGKGRCHDTSDRQYLTVKA